MKKILLIMLLLFVIFGCSSNISKYEGEYADSTSERASMNAILENGKLHIEVQWANSATSTSEWSMNATLKDNKLVYDDCEKKITTFENGKAFSIVEYENTSGYFAIKGDKLYWVGAYDLYATKCVFEKIK